MINRLLDLDVLDENNEKSFRANRELCNRVHLAVVVNKIIDGDGVEDELFEMKCFRYELIHDMFEWITKVSWSGYQQHKSMSKLFKKFTDTPTAEEEVAYDEKIKGLDMVWDNLTHQGLNSLYQDWLNSDGGGNGIHKSIPYLKLKKSQP